MAAEFEIIARHFAPIAGSAGLGLVDDAALLQPPPGHDLVVTTDALVAGIHFFPDDPPETLGHKALAVNLSDLAAKGADPLGFVLSLMMPDGVDDAWLAAFARGLGALAQISACPLVGGDTVFSKQALALSITAFGVVPAGTMVRRRAAQTGDHLYVTGTIGDAALGLGERRLQRDNRSSSLAADHASFLIERYLMPRPRNGIVQALRQYAHAAMDISDGFVGDLTKMVSLVGCGADVVLAKVPHSVAARAAFRQNRHLEEKALTGGDDYEVLAAIPPDHTSSYKEACLSQGLSVTQVGVVTERGKSVRFLDENNRERHFVRLSYVHGQSQS